MKVNVIGYGQVGQATAIGLKQMGYDVEAYDIVEKENLYNSSYFKIIPLHIGRELPKEGINVVCISDRNLDDNRQEVSHVAEVLNKLNSPIILRTTILPRYLSLLKFDFYWVEFLHEKKAIEEFLNPERVVVGRRDIREFPFEKDFKNIYYCAPEEASAIKYLSNYWNSMRIAFTNEYGDMLLKEGIKLENVIDYFFEQKKYLKWGNAFGGFCLPKDTNALLREYPEMLILEATIKANKVHKDKYPDLESIY